MNIQLDTEQSEAIKSIANKITSVFEKIAKELKRLNDREDKKERN